ncbi:MAG TPA: ABC transporter permease [Anaerolineales bacterium]|nr:ABC transporter permease [Anaerolineales bacterium]
MKSRLRSRLFDQLVIPVLAILSGLALASIFVWMAGTNPLTAYADMFSTAFSCEAFERCDLFTTLQLATPLMLTGLSAVVAFRSGLFSLGQEGQLMLGGMMAAWLGYAVQLPPVIHPLFAIAAAMLIGGLYGLIPGILKVRLGVNEIISTIVLNNIANLFVTYLINFPLRADQSTTAHSHPILDSARMLPLAPGSKFGIGFFIAILATLVVTLYLWRTSPGYEERMSGQAPFFARYGGVPHQGAAIRGMFLSGMLGGLAGAIQALGVHYRMLSGFSGGLGFDGLTAAILGQVHPVGTAVVAIFFAGLRQGAQVGLQFTSRVPRELGGGIIALMILFVAADQIYRANLDRLSSWWNRLRRRPAVREAA